MSVLDKTAFANRTTRLLGGRNQPTMIATAFAAVFAVLIAGMVLASNIGGLYTGLSSKAIQSLAAPGETIRLARILSDTDSSALLIKYIDSMADVVSNMEVSSKWGFEQFSAILDASKAARTSIEEFACVEDGTSLMIFCTGDGMSSVRFQDALTKSGCFTLVEIATDNQKDEREFTMRCAIS